MQKPRPVMSTALLGRLSVVLIAVTWIAPATAQDAAGPGPGGTSSPTTVSPLRPTFPDEAYVLEPGVLQVETGYALAFIDQASDLHVWDIYAALAVADLVEVRLGWDALNAAGGEAGVGDLTLGLKGGFLGGIDERTALAGVFALELPTGSDPFGLGEGVRFVAGAVATAMAGPVQLDFQATADLHLFLDDPTFLVPLAIGVTWPPVHWLRLYADAVVGLDLEDFSDTRTSLLAGAGFLVLPELEVSAGGRLGLSKTVPDAVIQVGLAWRIGDLF